MIASQKNFSFKKKIFKWIVFIFLIIITYNFFFINKISIQKTVIITRGDTFSKFIKDLSRREKIKLKTYTKFHTTNIDNIKEGSYVLSGNYSFKEFLEHIAKGPTQEYIRYTILEGRSMYDIDADLAKKGYANSGEYIKYVSDYGIFSKLIQEFKFLNNFGNLPNLEGFLYPDTYFIDVHKTFVPQLVRQQLKAFDTKVWQKMSGDMQNFNEKIKYYGINLTHLTINPYQILIIASIIEKEEKNNKNKPIIAGIFLKRLQIGMRLDADITLCYGLKQGYENCTPELIVKYLNDKKNVYNTRIHSGLPPQAIANPSARTIDAVLNFQISPYLFYLHDIHGQIYYAKDILEHNQNKIKYLK